jgi:hypothetical protein
VDDVVTVEGRWPDENGPWHITIRLADLDGRLECVGVAVSAAPDENGAVEPIRATGFRRIPLDSLIRQAISAKADDLADVVKMGVRGARRLRDADADSGVVTFDDAGKVVIRSPDEIRGEMAATTERARRLLAAARTGGRPPLYDADHYAELAEVYNRAVKLHQAPTKAVGEHFGYRPTTAAKHVQKARTLGFELAPPPRGGFQPGKKG